MTESDADPATWAFGRAARAHFALSPGITYLNHGTVGATPRRVLAAADRLREQIEAQPARFLLRELVGWPGMPDPGSSRLRIAAASVAPHLGAQADDLVFVHNATDGIYAAMRAANLRPGQSVVTTSHSYGAVALGAAHLAAERGARHCALALPDHAADAAELLGALERGLPDDASLLVIDHIISDTGLVLPAAEIVALAHQRGIRVVVDGAHAPGSIPLNAGAIGADWYVGNLHKWAWAPRACAVMVVAPEHHAHTHPNVPSWGIGQGLAAAFDWVGTADPTPALTAPFALELLAAVGAERVRAWGHALVVEGARRLSARFGTAYDTDPSLVGTMTALRLPQRFGATPEAARALRDRLLEAHQIEVHVGCRGGGLHVRLAAAIHNSPDDLDRLGDALEELA